MIYEITYSRRMEIDAPSMVVAREMAAELARQDPTMRVGLVEAQERRLERERREVEHKAWRERKDAIQRRHPLLEHRRDGKWECGGCLRIEDTEDAFLDSCCLGWAMEPLNLVSNHEAGEHNFTTRAKVGDGEWGPETYLYDHKCPRCIAQRMRGEETRGPVAS